MSLQPFPTVPLGEFTVTRPFTAPGLFAYRHMQAEGLLHFPDFSEGDMNNEQRREALDAWVNIQCPLTALILFLGVVALEDFIRDLGARVAGVPNLKLHFPYISKLELTLKKNPAPYARQDIDPAPLSDWSEVNSLYQRALGIAPIDQAELPKLYDLALIRHTVAHHAALVRPIDAPRFQYWELQKNTQINPPAEFVREIQMFIYQTGRSFENAVSNRLFSTILKTEPQDWYQAPSELLLSLIKEFNWFGKLVTDDTPQPMPGIPNYEDEQRLRNDTIRAQLTQLCIDDLRKNYAA